MFSLSLRFRQVTSLAEFSRPCLSRMKANPVTSLVEWTVQETAAEPGPRPFLIRLPSLPYSLLPTNPTQGREAVAVPLTQSQGRNALSLGETSSETYLCWWTRSWVYSFASGAGHTATMGPFRNTAPIWPPPLSRPLLAPRTSIPA